MKKMLLILAFACSSLSLFAQEYTQTFVLYFETDSSSLSTRSVQTLDSVKQLLGDLDEYQIELSGHTDQQGSIWYNQALSARREMTAFKHLQSIGIDQARIRTAHFGESRLAERIEGQENIAANRRVEVRVNYLKFNTLDELLQYTRLHNEQVQEFNDNGVQEVVGEKGTQLIVPADAFKTKDGRLVQNSEVKFVLEEFPGNGAAVAHGLSTVSNGKILESGGMFRMEAIAGNDTLLLREGKRIDVMMPSNNLQNGMSVFVGERNEQGDVVWTDTKESFELVDTTPIPKLPLPGRAEKLLAMQVELPARVGYRELDFKWNRPSAPVKPREPREPSKPTEPQMPDGKEPGWTYIFKSDWRSYYKSQDRYLKSMEGYNKRYDNYLRRKAEYDSKIAKWPQDSADYVAQVNSWDSYLNDLILERTALLDSVAAFYDAFRFNAALNSFARKVRDSVYYKASMAQELNRASKANIDIDVRFAKDHLMEEIMYLTMIKHRQDLQFKKLIYQNGMPNLNKFKKVCRLHRISISNQGIWKRGYNRFNTNQVYDAELKDTLKSNFLIETGMFIQQRKRELGIFDRYSMKDMYSASLGSMGFVNCDRFADMPPNMMARIDVQADPNTKLFVVLPDMNSVIPLYSGHDSAAVVQLPIGKEIKVISIGTFQGKPTLAMQHYKVKKEENKIRLNARLVSLETLNRTIAKL